MTAFWWFSEDFRPLSEDFRRFSKIVPKARLTFPNIFREFPKISEDARRLPKPFEEDPKMFRCYTNAFKHNLRDKLDISEIIDIFTCEDIISSQVRISYRFYEFVTTRYTTDFYIISIFSQLVGNKMAIAEGRKCSSETQNVPAGRVIKVVEAAVEYAQWLF